MKRKHFLQRMFSGSLPVLLLVGGLLASCSQDELAEQGMSLPDGMYPMTFTTVQAVPESAPQTRVSENAGGMSSTWDGGEIIKVTVSGDGNNMETDCTLGENGTITAYNPQLYWQNTNYATINAWYSNITGQSTEVENTVSLDNQSSGLAYVLKVEVPVEANYNTGNIPLKFSHQLAKIRVELKADSYLGDLSNATVKVKGHTSCTVKNGEVSESSGEGYIQMHKNGEYYEANLVPGTLQKSEAFEIIANNKSTKASLQSEVSLAKGKVHNVTITVKQKVTEVNLNDLTSTYTISQGGVYILTGTTTHRITIKADATVILKDVTINSTNGAPIQISGNRTATLMLEGNNNTLTAPQYYSAILPDQGSTVVIDGKGSLKAQGGEKGAGIGASNNDDQPFMGTWNHAGHVRILDGIIEAIGGFGSTGIGCSMRANCQSIEILGGTVTAKAGSGYANPAIGGPSVYNGQCGSVTLNKCEIHAYPMHDAAAISAGTVTPSIDSPDALKTAEVNLTVYR